MEIWKTIRNYEGLYEISSSGRVKSLPKYNRTTEKILEIQNRSNKKSSYKSICLTKEKKKKTFSIHRLVAEAFIPFIDKNKIFINHIDGNKQNNNKDNLEWATPSENNLHAYKYLGLSRENKGLEKSRLLRRKKSENKIIDFLDKRFISFRYQNVDNKKSKTKTIISLRCNRCGEICECVASWKTLNKTGGVCKKCSNIIKGENISITKKRMKI